MSSPRSPPGNPGSDRAWQAARRYHRCRSCECRRAWWLAGRGPAHDCHVTRRIQLRGFYLSLGPSLAAQLSGSRNLLWGGVITFLLTGLGAVTAAAFRNSAPPAVMLGGCLGLLGGAVVTVAAIVARTPALLLLGTVMAGLGFGPANVGAYRVIMARADSSNRAGLIAAVSTVNYLAFGLPVLIAGIATSHSPRRDHQARRTLRHPGEGICPSGTPQARESRATISLIVAATGPTAPGRGCRRR
jgi:MFS family permease